MRYVILAISTALIVGCSVTPPKPPTFSGEYRPVNKIAEAEAIGSKERKTFDFVFEGDIANALTALKTAYPGLNVSPPTGDASPLLIRVNLRGVTLEDALRAIGEQGGTVAEVVWSSTHSRDVNQAFIRYRTTSLSADRVPASQNH